KGHRCVGAEQLNELDARGGEILLEPPGRNTAPAVALAAIKAIEKGSDPLLLVIGADHVITVINAVHEAIKQAQRCAETGRLVTFGIVPDKPEPGYGYIRRGKKF
ncbi:mannose-1-phosphate guanylyltransferase/mannose-6-phosphate isomerase, partial [Pseudoalteromonas sp. S326]|uniref:sugar phosphate nucleotidyltransferase n=1 Tax=Pseudoalteromonas sp. S326 TaxID=579533 RepID=UPI00126E4DC0